MRILAFLILFFPVNLHAQNGDYFDGARAMGMGKAVVAVKDEYSSINNIAGVSAARHEAIAFSVHNLYQIKGLNVFTASGHLRYRHGAFFLSAFRFGDDVLNENKLGIGYSHTIRFVSLGIRVNYVQFRSSGSASLRTVNLEMGGIAEILPSLAIGAYLFYPGQPLFNEHIPYAARAHLKAGTIYRPESNTVLACQVDKTPGEKMIVRTGIEHFLKGKIYLRAGMSLDPQVFFTGFGIPIRKIQVDHSISIHPALGISYQFSLVFKFLRRDEKE